jgi:hypothetical protein
MENRLGNEEKLENRTIKRSLGTEMEKKESCGKSPGGRKRKLDENLK